MKKLIILLLTLSILNLNAQSHWEIEEMAEMPEAVTNNAVCEGFYVGPLAVSLAYVFSFGGLDTSLAYSGIHNKSWRYSVNNNTWNQIADIPSVDKTIASSASYINGKIYIIGGYTVASNGSETSSDQVYIYDVSMDSFLSNGTALPMPIDDQVQCVYKDSLIFVVTGWSNTGNVPTVQIYDIFNNTWTIASSTPNNNDYKAFGSNGIIVGDTLYYYGGANTATNFPATNFIRKGYINPSDPTDISWTIDSLSISNAYRMACTSVNDTIFWIGGSEISYNFNAVAYDGSGIVNPSNNFLQYTQNEVGLLNHSFELPMDIRGIASLTNTVKYLCGGIENNGKVSKKLLKLTWKKDQADNIVEVNSNRITFQNPVLSNEIIFSKEVVHINISNTKGQLLFEDNAFNQNFLELDFLTKGVYYLQLNNQFYKFLKK